MIKRFLSFQFAPTSIDAALLALRVITGASIFAKHGYEKIFHFSHMYDTTVRYHTYVTLLGPHASLVCAALSDGICTILMIVGFATRWSALYVVMNLLVAWAVVGHMVYWQGAEGGHGELIIAYIAATLALVLAGGGRYSLDHLLLDQKRS